MTQDPFYILYYFRKTWCPFINIWKVIPVAKFEHQWRKKTNLIFSSNKVMSATILEITISKAAGEKIKWQLSQLFHTYKKYFKKLTVKYFIIYIYALCRPSYLIISFIGSNGWSLLNAYSVQATLALYIRYLIKSSQYTVLWIKYIYCVHFTDEETKLGEIWNLPMVMWLVRDRPGIWSQFSFNQNPCLYPSK